MKSFRPILGGYKLKNVVQFEGHEGYGYNANLYRNTVLYAQMKDMGDGGETYVDIDYSKLDTISKKVREDFKELLNVSDPNCIGRIQLKSIDGRLDLIANLIFELQDMYDFYSKHNIKKWVEDNNAPVALITLGPSFFDNEYILCHQMPYLIATPVYISEPWVLASQIYNFIKEKAKEYNAPLEKCRVCTIKLIMPSNEDDWDIKMKDYADMVSVSKQVNNLIKKAPK